MNPIHAWLESWGLTAPWLQAYGAILALLIAIFISSLQARQEHRRERRKLQSYMQAIAAVSENALVAAKATHSDLGNIAFRFNGVQTSELAYSLESLKTVTLESLPDKTAFMAIYRLRKTLSWVLESALAQNPQNSPQGVNPDLVDSVELSISRAEENYAEFIGRIEGLR